MENVKTLIKFMTQCHRIAAGVSHIQTAMLLAMYQNESEPFDKNQLAKRLDISKSTCDRQLKSLMSSQLFRRNNQTGEPQLVEVKLVQFSTNEEWFSYIGKYRKLELTDRGRSFCSGLITNSRHFWST